MFKKIYIAVDVVDEEQQKRLQRIAEDLSNARLFNGNQLEYIYPIYRQYENDIRHIFQMVKTNGFGPSAMLTIGKMASKMLEK